MTSESPTSRASDPARRYLREPVPLHFPTSAEVPETRRHLELRTALFQMLQAAFGDRAIVGSDQFVYWEPLNPSACCAPDVMLRLGEPDAPFDSWKVWERGAPHLAIEIVSASDTADQPWASKLDRYRHVGVTELVCFDPDHASAPLRIWSRVTGDLVERDANAPAFAKSDVLPGLWRVVDNTDGTRTLRLARDEAGATFFLTPIEQHQAAEVARQQAEAARQQADAAQQRAEAARQQAEAARQQAEAAQQQAEASQQQAEVTLARTEADRLQAQARIAELEAELARLSRR